MDNSWRLTSQLIISDTEAVLAFSCRRDRRGPNGETDEAVLLATNDRGCSWSEIPWRRSLWMWLRGGGYPVWPPESVSAVELPEQGDAQLQIVFRDEWAPYDSGAESLWQGQLRHGRWTAKRIRHMDYEDRDVPGTLPACEWALPDSFRPPGALSRQRP